MTDLNDNYARPAGTATPAEHLVLEGRLRHVSWGAIILGLVVAIAFQILLGLLGIGLGFTIVDPADPMGGLAAWGIASSIYLVITQIIALFIGGYIAARLASARTDQSAMFHGLSIWALATIAMVWIGANAVGVAVSGLSSAVSGIASAATQTVGAMLPDEISLPDISYEALPEPLKEALRENNISPEDLQQELRSAYREVVSPEEQRRLIQELQRAIRDILRNPTNAPQQIDEAMNNIFGEQGILSEQDLNQLENTLQRSLNLSDQEIQQITSQIQQATQEARRSIREAVQTAEQEAVQAAKAVSDRIGRIALWMFFANVLGLIAAVLGGRIGEVKTGV